MNITTVAFDSGRGLAYTGLHLSAARSRTIGCLVRTSLYEIVTFSWNLDFSVVTPSGFGGNWALARVANTAVTQYKEVFILRRKTQFRISNIVNTTGIQTDSFQRF